MSGHGQLTKGTPPGWDLGARIGLVNCEMSLGRRIMLMGGGDCDSVSGVSGVESVSSTATLLCQYNNLYNRKEVGSGLVLVLLHDI